MASFDFGVKVDPQVFDRQINDGYQVKVTDYIRQGWKMYKEHIGGFVGFSLIVCFVYISNYFLSTFLSIRFGPIVSLLYSVVITGLFAALSAGYGIVVFRLLSGQQFEFADFFKGFNYFLPLFLAGLAAGFLVFIGSVLLIIPGIYLAVSYMFVTFLIIDYRMEFWQAMETSRKIITKNWFDIYGFSLTLISLYIPLFLFLYLGSFVVIITSRFPSGFDQSGWFVQCLFGLFGLGALALLLVTISVTSCAAAIAYKEIAGLYSNDW